MNFLKNYKIVLKISLLLGLLYFPIFLHLEHLPIRIWDEARLAINAYEMHENGNFIVTYFKGNPDMWNTKPPLMIWLQVIFIKLFGVGELAIRLPSAIAALLTCVLILGFSLKYLKSFWYGFIASLILVTSTGYISIHGIRTGDYDSLLVFFLTYSTLAFFVYLENVKKAKYLYHFMIALILAALTKGIAGLMLTPALIVYVLLKKQFILLLKNKHLYINLGIFIVVVFGYYILREYYNPGYIKAVFENEVGGRYLNTIESHKHEFWFYYKNLIHERFKPWFWLVPVGITIGLITKEKKIRDLTLCSILIVVQYFFTISFSQTKLSWYDLPLYPFLSILAAIPVYVLLKRINSTDLIKSKILAIVISFLVLFGIFYFPYNKIISSVFKPSEYPWESDVYSISYYLRESIDRNNNNDDYIIIYEGYKAHIDFYVRQLKNQEVNISFKDKEMLKTDDIVFVSKNNLMKFVEENYNFEILYHKNSLKKYRIK